MNAPQLLLLLFERLSLFCAAEQAILRELSSNFVYEVLEKKWTLGRSFYVLRCSLNVRWNNRLLKIHPTRRRGVSMGWLFHRTCTDLSVKLVLRFSLLSKQTHSIYASSSRDKYFVQLVVIRVRSLSIFVNFHVRFVHAIRVRVQTRRSSGNHLLAMLRAMNFIFF